MFEEREMKANLKNVLETLKLKLLKSREVFMWKRADALIAVTKGIKFS